MKYFLSLLMFWLVFAIGASAQSTTAQKVKFKYKAYWGGFVVAEINSETVLDASNYETVANYRVKGVAMIMGKMENRTMARGILHSDGTYHPDYYESMGNFGKLIYNNQVTFDPETLYVTDLVQDLKLRKDTEYIPIADEEKYGMDPMTIFLNMILNQNFKEAYSEEVKTRQFGGMFVSEQSFICDQTKEFKQESRSVFKGEAFACKIDGKAISGDIKSTKPRKKRRRGRERDDQDSRLYFGKMPDFEGTVPVYTEFPIGWGKVRIYLSEFSVEPIKGSIVTAKNSKADE